jgi:hypothetical protein
MVTELDAKLAQREPSSWLERNSPMWSASNERQSKRSLDCAAMERMSLSALLYYVLVGDGGAAALPSAC